MIFVSYLPILKILLSATLLFFLAGEANASWTMPALLLLQAALFIMLGKWWLKCFFSDSKRPVANALSSHQIRIGELRLLGWFSGILTFFAYLQHGMPLLSGDPNAAKVLLSDSWLLMRGLRFIVPIVVFLRCYLYFAHGEKWSAGDKFLGGFFLLIAAGSGYKGYVLSYLILPGVFAYSVYSKARSSLIKTFGVAMIGLVLVVLNIAFNEGLSVADGLAFLFLRVSYAQAEGSINIILHPDNFVGISPMGLNVQSLLTRVSGGAEVLNFNAFVFDVIHGENPFKMQISVPLFVEASLEAGNWGVFAILAAELILLRTFLRTFAIRSTLISLGLTFGMFLLFVDVAMNGGLLLRLIDLGISSALFLISVFVVKIFIFACTREESEINIATNC